MEEVNLFTDRFYSYPQILRRMLRLAGNSTAKVPLSYRVHSVDAQSDKLWHLASLRFRDQLLGLEEEGAEQIVTVRHRKVVKKSAISAGGRVDPDGYEGDFR
jgi:hypothetical protein